MINLDSNVKSDNDRNENTTSTQRSNNNNQLPTTTYTENNCIAQLHENYHNNDTTTTTTENQIITPIYTESSDVISGLENVHGNERATKRNTLTNKATWKMMYSNARGMRGKLRSLESLLNENQPHLLLLTETQLRSNAGINITGYTFHGRNSRKSIRWSAVPVAPM